MYVPQSEMAWDDEAITPRPGIKTSHPSMQIPPIIALETQQTTPKPHHIKRYLR